MTTRGVWDEIALASRIEAYARAQKEAGTQFVWRFSQVAEDLGVTAAEVEAACRTLGFRLTCHVREGCFFLKTHEEVADDLAWTTGTGRFAQ